MINTNYTINNNINFKANPALSKVYEEMAKLTPLEKQEVIVPKIKETLNLSSFTDAALTAGKIAADFVYKELTTLLLCLWTVPGILAGAIGGTTLFCYNHIENKKYPNGHEKYKIEKIDKKASKLEDLYNDNPKKYYERTNSVIFDYYDALKQIGSEEEKLSKKISGIKNKKGLKNANGK